jgi:GH15 family glucan-1,4-alpha-glucosidase
MVRTAAAQGGALPSLIEDYAIIGDCETAALVSKEGCIDWLCWPRFDSPACFAILLGGPENGRWKIAPVASPKNTTRRYRPGTLILETTFETEQGSVEIIDFMPLRGEHSHLVRLVHGLHGEVSMRMELSLRFDYGRSVPWVTRLDDGTLRAIAGPNMTVLRTTAEMRGENLHTVSDFTVKRGETIPFVMTYGDSHLPVPARIDPYEALIKTEEFWRDWTSKCSYRGPWEEAVGRSLITLKALTYWPTGGIIAAPTTSLPEDLGGVRNWDYRFCWLRDASFTLWVLMEAGYYEEAGDWQNWLLRAAAGSPDQLQAMYALRGERQLNEWEVNWLPGYENSRPVRVGNAAAEQLQLDTYGEIASVLHQAEAGGLPRNEPGVALQRALLKHLEKIWREPDEGIWEVRSGRRQFTHSKVMAWVAFDRAVRNAEKFGFEGPVERWRELRKEIHDDVCANGFDPELGSFVQSYGSKQLDASLLIMPKTGFLPPSDPRILGTIRAIESELMCDGFVLRYKTEETKDGLPPGEGVFLPCSFWLADAYALTGRYAEAKQLFERLIQLLNDVGLLSEEYDVGRKRMLGNFPQAFSHVALVNTALLLSSCSEEEPCLPELTRAR